MAIAVKDDKSFLEKLQLYFENYPGRCCDVSFVVGSGDEKEVIQTSRIILEVACPEFIKLFDEKWGQGVVVKNNEEFGSSGIPLPDVDPNAFKILLKLLMLDDASVDSLTALNIPSKDLLDVIGLCEKYKMLKIQENLETVAQNTIFGSIFSTFAKTNEFVELSKSNFNTVLRNDNLDANETEIFEAAIRWAEKRCSERDNENTGENIREILGDSIFRIRFPTMTLNQFMSNVALKTIFTAEEQLELIRYIFSKEQGSITLETETVLAFDKTERIRRNETSLQLLNGIQVVNNPSFVCDGTNKAGLFLKVNQEIEICSVGFLGPIDSDSFYDVTLEMQYNDGSSWHSTVTAEKKLFAKKDEIFYVSFDQPIKMNATYTSNNWNGKRYYMIISLKGPNTTIPQNPNGWKDFRAETDKGVGFYCRIWNTPLAELRFRKC